MLITIITEGRQKGRFAGFSLYVSISGVSPDSTLCYKDEGPQLPSLNLSIACAETGRYVIFYNERLDGVTYPTGYELVNVFTELCEVVVKGKFNFKRILPQTMQNRSKKENICFQLTSIFKY